MDIWNAIWPFGHPLDSAEAWIPVFLVSAIIFIAVGVLIAAGISRLQLHRSLGRLRKLLPPDGTEVTVDDQAKMRQLANTDGKLSNDEKTAWLEFDETLVSNQTETLGEADRVYNTVPAEEFFNEKTLAPGLVHNRLLNVWPVVLTTLGLVGTFLGLTLGLSGLDLEASGDGLKSGIQGLVNGASLGFTASFWGVGLGLIVNFLLRVIERTAISAIHKLQSDIDRRFTMQSPEHSLTLIASSTSATAEGMSTLHEKIGNAFQESVQSVSRQLSTSVGDVGAQTQEAVSAAMQTSLQPLMTKLAEISANQATVITEQIAADISNAFAQVGTGIATEMRDSAQSLLLGVTKLDEAIERQQTQFEATIERQQDLLETSLTRISSATEAHTTAIEKSMSKIETSIHTTSVTFARISEHMHASAESFKGTTEAVGLTTEQLDSSTKSALSTLQQISESSAEMLDAIKKQEARIQNLTSNADATNTALISVSKELSTGITSLKSSHSTLFQGLNEQLDEHSKAMTVWLHNYADRVSEQTADRMGEWDKHTRDFANSMLEATQNLKIVLDEMQIHLRPETQVGGEPTGSVQ